MTMSPQTECIASRVSPRLAGRCCSSWSRSIILHTLICLLILLFGLTVVASGALIVRTPATKKYFNVYRQTMPADYNVVENGGWSALEERATNELATTKMEAMRPYLASDFNVTRAGGWELLQQMAADPKGVLIQYIQHLLRLNNAKTDIDIDTNNSKLLTRVKSAFDREDAVRPIPPDYLEGIRALLYAQGKGFDAQLVEGEWILVLQQRKHASQKYPPKVEKKLCDAIGDDDSKNSLLSISNFDRARSLITGTSRFWKNLGTANVELRYKTNPSKFSTRGGSSVVFRRISCSVVENKVKLLGSRIPSLRKRRGYSGFLDFVYMDDEIRMTINEQGDLFVHARPDAVQRLFCD